MSGALSLSNEWRAVFSAAAHLAARADHFTRGGAGDARGRARWRRLCRRLLAVAVASRREAGRARLQKAVDERCERGANRAAAAVGGVGGVGGRVGDVYEAPRAQLRGGGGLRRQEEPRGAAGARCARVDNREIDQSKSMMWIKSTYYL